MNSLLGPEIRTLFYALTLKPKPHISKCIQLIFCKQIGYVMNSWLGPKIGTLPYTLTLTLNPISQKMLKINIFKTD